MRGIAKGVGGPARRATRILNFDFTPGGSTKLDGIGKRSRAIGCRESGLNQD